MIVAVKVSSNGRSEMMSEAFAQQGVPCGSDPSCGTVVSPVLPGDANCDGVVSELDVPVLTGNVFACNACPECPLTNSDANCDGFVSVADLEALADPCTFEPTPTPTPGLNDCCQCDGTVCEVPMDGGCPSTCSVVYDSACIESTGCVPNTPTQTLTPTVTPTPTLGANDCCVCEGNTCAVPMDSACPTGCTAQYDSACTDTGACVGNTPTPTLTPTLGANDCCQCDGVACAVPMNAACPQDCAPVFDSACVAEVGCVANTVTPTPTPTLGANDCCVCEGNTCAVPMDSACPTGCTPQADSACTDTGACVANTPTQTLTPTITPTPPLGPNDCCVCEGNTCAVPMDQACPTGCTPQLDSACTDTGACVANTPTPTLTPTLGPNDCCQCEGNVCTVPDGTCPTGCTAEYDSACTDAGACVRNTPTPTRTRPAAGTRTRTPTMTPLVIPFPC